MVKVTQRRVLAKVSLKRGINVPRTRKRIVKSNTESNRGIRRPRRESRAHGRASAEQERLAKRENAGCWPLLHLAYMYVLCQHAHSAFAPLPHPLAQVLSLSSLRFFPRQPLIPLSSSPFLSFMYLPASFLLIKYPVLFYLASFLSSFSIVSSVPPALLESRDVGGSMNSEKQTLAPKKKGTQGGKRVTIYTLVCLIDCLSR